jgi:Tfp pilus assembly protein PilF
MIDLKATLRGALTVFVALAITAMLVRPQLSMALTTRGDALAFAGDVRALEFYRRALVLDPQNDIAIDHLATRAILSHRRDLLEETCAVATAFLRRRASAVGIRMDRALALQILHRRSEAAAEFMVTGLHGRDVRALLFAADDYAAEGKVGRARAAVKDALRIDPAFIPARVALARLR